MEILGPKNTVSVNTIDGFWGRLETAKQKIRKLKQSRNYSDSSKERKKNGKHGNEHKSYMRCGEKVELSGNWSHRVRGERDCTTQCILRNSVPLKLTQHCISIILQ